TAGKLFAAGRAGDRFAVRNSGAIAVIEGAGAHCCEYMTGGVVVVLGPVGRNFAAGMSNGVAYVLDEAETFTARCNGDMVAVRALEESDEQLILSLLGEHVGATGSARGRAILDSWERYREGFRTVIGCLGDSAALTEANVATLPGVESVTPWRMPHRLASRQLAPRADRTVVRIGDGPEAGVGGPALVVIAGPCSVEGPEMLLETARGVGRAGAGALRGGAFKPRTSPYALQGL